MGRLAPSGRALLPELSMLAETAVAAALVLRKSVARYAGRFGGTRELAQFAHVAEALTALITTDASQALMPPIDSEDATELASRLEVVVRGTYRLGRLADIVCLNGADANVVRLADLLVRATDSVEGAAATMTERFEALDFAGDVRRTARRGDRVYVEAMGTMFAAAPDAFGAVRQASLYRALQESLGECVAAGAVIERIVLKRF